MLMLPLRSLLLAVVFTIVLGLAVLELVGGRYRFRRFSIADFIGTIIVLAIIVAIIVYCPY